MSRHDSNFEYLTGTINVPGSAPARWAVNGLAEFYEDPNHEEWGAELCRVLYHETLHFWQVLAWGHVSGFIADDWNRLQHFEKTGEILPDSYLVHVHKKGLEGQPFSGWQLLECITRYWEVHTRGPHTIARDLAGDPSLPQSIADLPVALATYSHADFDAVMTDPAGDATYTAPYRWMMEKAQGNSTFVAVNFPYLAHFAFRSTQEDPVGTFCDLFDFALADPKWREVTSMGSGIINFDWLDHWVPAQIHVLGAHAQANLHADIPMSGLEEIEDDGALANHPVFATYPPRIAALRGYFEALDRARPPVDPKTLEGSELLGYALRNSPLKDPWVVFGLPGQPAYRLLLGTLVPPPRVHFENMTLVAGAPPARPGPGAPVVVPLVDVPDRDEMAELLQDLDRRVEAFRIAESAVPIGLSQSAFDPEITLTLQAAQKDRDVLRNLEERKDALALTHIGYEAGLADDYELAADAYDRAVRVFSTWTSDWGVYRRALACAHHAEALRNLGRLAEAEEATAQAVRAGTDTKIVAGRVVAAKAAAALGAYLYLEEGKAGTRDEGLAQTQRAAALLEDATTTDTLTQSAEVQFNLGVMYSQLGDHGAEAHRAYEQAMADARRAAVSAAVTYGLKAAENLTNLSTRMKDGDDAVSALRSVIDYCVASGAPDTLTEASRAASILAARIDASEDRPRYEAALEEALRFGIEASTEAATEQACTAARLLGNLYYENDHARAGSYYERAISLAEGVDTPEAALEISWSATALGALHASAGERDKATACFEMATEAGLRCGDGQGLTAAEASFQYANMLANSEQSQEASSRYENAVTLAVRADTPNGLDTAAKAALVHGGMLERIGRTEDCVSLYERALEIASRQETVQSKQIVELATTALDELAAKR